MPESNFKNQFNYILTISAAIYVIATAVHAISHYSGVPLWDSWLGMIDFLNNHQERGVSYWFSQHFEHRIFITRIFFWLDYVFFNAQNWFLIVINYSLAGLIFLLFVKIIQEVFQDLGKDKKYLRNLLIFVSFIFTFSKIQNDNFSWEFQSQFFLAYLLPLFSLYLLGKSSKSFIFACFCGILSSLTMANGVFALFFMIFAGFLLKIDRNRLFILTGLALFTLSSYLFNYQKPEGHSFIESLYRPAEVFLYLISFFGSAVYFIFGSFGSRVFGLLMLILSLFTLQKIFKQRNVPSHWIDVILTVFILYVIFSGILIAIGRVATFNTGQAFAQRYATPVFMAMVSLLIIYRNYLQRYFIFLLTLPFLLFQIGMADVEEGNRKVFEKNVAALALQLGIMDKNQIIEEASVIGDFGDEYYKEVLNIAKKASKNNISIFNDPLIKDANEQIGQKLSKKPESCQENLILPAKITKINGEKRFSFIKGKIKDGFDNYFDESLYLINEKNIIIGYVLVNKRRNIFKGYYDRDVKGVFFLYNLNIGCRIEVNY